MLHASRLVIGLISFVANGFSIVSLKVAHIGGVIVWTVLADSGAPFDWPAEKTRCALRVTSLPSEMPPSSVWGRLIKDDDEADDLSASNLEVVR
jgi:hypothetical protein